MRIAIVGAGVSGLVVAHLLHERHDVTLFEAAGYAGGHTNTIRVDTPNETHQIDTGFIVFNDRNYPSFERLLARLGVAWQPSTMSFGVSDGVGDFEYSGASPNGLFANRRHLLTPWFHRMVTDLARFNRAARELLALEDAGRGPSLGDWLERQRFSRAFIDRLIVPQASAVWSADPRQMWSFPARFLAEFFDHHGMLGFRGRPQWRTVRGGSKRYVDALLEQFTGRLRLGRRSRRSRVSAGHVLVRPAGGEAERFDEVVLATHSDQALALLEDASTREREILGAIPYQHNEAVLHTDVRLLPAAPARVGELELPLAARAGGSRDRHLPHEPPAIAAGRARVLRHAQPNRRDRPGHVIRTIAYAHPVYTAAGVQAQARFEQVSGAAADPFLRRLLGLGVPRGRRAKRGPRGRAARGRPVIPTASCIYEGTIRHRRTEPRREFRHRLALFYLDLDELPRLLGGRLVAGASGPAAVPPPGLPRTGTDPTRPRRPRHGGGEHGAKTTRADPAPHPAALVRPLLQPGQLLLLPRRVGRAGRGGRRRGHEHAVGRAARVRPGRRDGRVRQGAPRVAVHGDGPPVHRPRRQPGRAPGRPHREPPRRRARVRRHPRAAPPRADAALRGARSRSAIRSRTSACSR